MPIPMTPQERLAMLQKIRALPGLTDYSPSPTIASEPFVQNALQTAQQEGAIQRADAMRRMAEGLGNIRGRTAGDVLLGTPQPKPFVAEGARTQLDRALTAAEPITPLQREAMSERRLVNASQQALDERAFQANEAERARKASLESLQSDREGLAGAREAEIHELRRSGMQAELDRANAPIGEGVASWLNETFGKPIYKPDTPLSQVNATFPEVAGILKKKMEMDDPYRWESLGLRKESLEMRKQEEARRREAQVAIQKRFDESWERVPDDDRRRFDGLKTAYQTLERIKGEYDPRQFGMIWGRWNEVARALNLAKPDTIKTQSDLEQAVMLWVYESTGKQINLEEMRRVAKIMPRVTDSPEVFTKLLGAFQDRLLEKQDYLIESLGLQGRTRAEDFRGFIEDKAAPPRRGTHSYEVSPEEPEFEIPASDTEAIEAAKRSGAKYRILEGK